LAFLGSDLTTLAQGFAGSRALNLAISWIAYQRIVGGLQFGGQPFKAVIGTLKRGFPYAADTGFTNFFSQVDILIVNHYLGTVSVGLYQAGMRFLQGASQFAPVLGNVYLPAIAGCGDKPEQLRRLSRKFNSQMILMGATGWAIFAFGGEWITRLIYGEKYLGLNPLWPYIGLLLFLRYVAASQGVLLTANGSQGTRVFAQIIGLVVVLSVSNWLIKEMALAGMLVTLSFTAVALILVYSCAAIVKRINLGLSPLTVATVCSVLVVALNQIKG
jgi:O-antigen/teichoic acid export membrane protein